ncbi:polynucleotide phosphorylase/polyadenylase, partial [Candidatus Thiomargarita nelsonii]
EAKELGEDIMLGAVLFGHQQMQVVIDAIQELASATAKPRWDWEPKPVDEKLTQQVKELAEQRLREGYQIQDKLERRETVTGTCQEIAAQLSSLETEEWTENQVFRVLEMLEKKIVRGTIIAGNARIDGRDTRTVRPITIRTKVLPRTHGSALFTRGETQAIVVTTLGTERDAQIIDALEGEYKENFL